ncbi:DUF3806 domain-containing protein [Cellulomonas composti]|uniref:DUF3806 domain-containing protein n=1 Tax=Cellulomonas composti TaxID=266130 RepID=A0A511JBW7_9CELL|nr:DUF3806 domain-containing protein [Cellulomonas composti]GEL95279.1 hypothetical protein CCO02nite_19370 [Cellulomonas composti]
MQVKPGTIRADAADMEPFGVSRPRGGAQIPQPHAPGDEAGGVVRPLNDAESVWAAQHRELVAELCDHGFDTPTVGGLFDRVHGTWLDAPDPGDPEPLVHAFGIGLGDLVRQRVPGLDWASYTDRAGTELVLSHAEHDLVIFPIASVGAHWGNVGPGWFAEHVDVVVDGALGRIPPHAP